MKEEKILFQSPTNTEAIQLKIERMERFGWILENKEYDQDRNITKFFYTRDLSILENQQKKELEEDAEDAFLAQKFAESNIKYCQNIKNKIKKPRSHKVVITIMIISILLCALLIYLFRFADILTYNKFETIEELENFKQTYIYQFPDGQTLFGKTSFTYKELINFLTMVLCGIATIFFAVILIMIMNTKKYKLIQMSEYEYINERQEFFEGLACEMEDFSQELNETMDLMIE